MDIDRWQLVERVYWEALQQAPANRDAFVREASAGDSDLLRQVERLLESTGDPRFLEQPALELALAEDGMTTGFLRSAFAQALGNSTAPMSRSHDEFRLAPGTRLGPYEIEQPLSAGGMGEVYRARDTRLGRAVAVKILARSLLDRPGIRRSFEAEARAISLLNHPHICTLYDIGSERDIDYLVMEYLQGETLAARLKQGALPCREAIRIAEEICDALAYAHTQGIVHRDLKPGNIMLTALGAKLVDFGLARWEQEARILTALPEPADPSLTITGLILGTPQYMAPEQIERLPLDGRTDIFALGTVIFEMIYGRKAFAGQTPAEVMHAILASEPRLGSDSAADRIIRRCLQKPPSRRWPSAGELLRELRRLEQSETPWPVLPLGPWLRWPLLAATILLAAASAGDLAPSLRPHLRFRAGTSLSSIHAFPLRNGESSNPTSLIESPDGRLFGTTARGGPRWAGTIFEVDPPRVPGGPWNHIVLYQFEGGSDGADPEGGLLIGPGGELYGTTGFGGEEGNGTVFELAPPRSPAGHWTEKVLHHFKRQGGDGGYPTGVLVFGSHGELYGTTQNGGTPGQGKGIVFQLVPTRRGDWTWKVIYTFHGLDDAANPEAGLVPGADGSLYGTTGCGSGNGGVFKLSPPAASATEWTFTALHRFDGRNGDGICSRAGLTRGPGGVLYGASTRNRGGGSIFELQPPDSPAGLWKETVLHTFTGLDGDGSGPSGGLVVGPNGEIYGVTSLGGASNNGTIFELNPPATPSAPWTQTVLYSFAGRTGLGRPAASPNPILTGRALYGVAATGGPAGGGMVFRLSF